MLRKFFVAAAAALWAMAGVASAQLAYAPVANDGSTGTIVGKLAKFTSAGNAITLLTSDTTWTGLVVGETVSTASPAITGNAILAIHGPASCIFDGTTVIGHYVTISSSVAGDCADTGAATYPTSGAVVGIVLAVNGGAGTAASTYLIPPGVQASSGGGNFDMMGGEAQSLAAATTTNCYPAGMENSLCNNTFDAVRQAQVTVARTFGVIAGATSSGFKVSAANTPGTGFSYTFTLFVNGVSTAVTCAISNSATSCSDTTHSATATAGQAFTVQIVTSASANALNGSSWSLTEQ